MIYSFILKENNPSIQAKVSIFEPIAELADEVLGAAAASSNSIVAWPSIFCCDLASCRDFISSVELTDEGLAPEISMQCSLLLVAEYKNGQN
ncbi:MAG: hypothetical protein ACI936_001889 [Paraglaciecola sp.]